MIIQDFSGAFEMQTAHATATSSAQAISQETCGTEQEFAALYRANFTS
jgi:hypothetical protein